jgi:hypothetical protein
MMICDDVESTKSRLLVAQLYGGVVNMGVAVPLDACVLNLHLDGRYINSFQFFNYNVSFRAVGF